MTAVALLLITSLFAPDPQPGLPSHERALANVKLARELREQCNDIANVHRNAGDMWTYYAWYGAEQDQAERVDVWWHVVYATDPELPWLMRRYYYHELVERIGARAVFSGEMVCPFGEWVPVVK
jgi:hypothetical protein